MSESIKLSAVIPAGPQRIYEAWLDGREHAAFTGGGAASVDRKVGGKFTAWDGYISGTNVELEPGRRIVQRWRTTNFSRESPDSHLEVLLKETPRGTRVTLVHTDIPDGQGQEYKQGWREFYLAPMKRYFAGSKSGA
ncbi:MAG: SRPBCC domain-containing protein [Chloroflexi bacterium]|nr:SRPBCC domain-containing protein [Chloroflexota bacterium]